MDKRKNSWKKLEEKIKKAKKDPEFMRALRAFIDAHSEKSCH